MASRVRNGNIDANVCAIARLRAYCPPPTVYYSLPLSRRAAVLILLFADRRGDLRVVLTIRSSSLKSYAGQAALPGGKADSLTETPFQTARREAYEEIGLPLQDSKLPYPYRVEHLCQLPTNLAKTELGVRPCVAFLSPTRTAPPASSISSSDLSPTTQPSSTPQPPPPQNPPSQNSNHPKAVLDAEALLIPRLSALEVAAVFSGPFHNFLRSHDESDPSPYPSRHSTGPHYSSASASSFPGHEAAGFPAEWYKGTWTDWHESRWRMHNFYIPVKGRHVNFSKSVEVNAAKAGVENSESKGESGPEKMVKREEGPPNASSPEDDEAAKDLRNKERFRVFGMTARILVDCARVAYAQEPDFEHNSHFGDEDMIRRLMAIGRLPAEKRKGSEFTREDLRRAAEHNL